MADRLGDELLRLAADTADNDVRCWLRRLAADRGPDVKPAPGRVPGSRRRRHHERVPDPIVAR
jgi:hypothetical protein